MVIGTYLMTDFQMNEIAPGVIDHKEWTVEDGPNNAYVSMGWVPHGPSTLPSFARSNSPIPVMEKIMP